MRIYLTSVFVDDQEKALRFYGQTLGFLTKRDIPLGEHRWLTMVSPEAEDGVELVLEPDSHPAVGPFKEALVADGTYENGVDDVMAADLSTRISVAASFEDGVLVLRPRDLPGVEVRRWREGDQLVWSYHTAFTTRMERVD